MDGSGVVASSLMSEAAMPCWFWPLVCCWSATLTMVSFGPTWSHITLSLSLPESLRIMLRGEVQVVC